eukprot:CCRYP_004908-RA/>CCRYP_004908-RA protein AED:0.24 eAED:0.19 QI:0/-1/0/1/-1/0/1/0/335
MLYETTQQLVNEGERNVSLALEISKQKDELKLLRHEAESFRAALLQGISGVTDSKNYDHVSLEDLLRIRLQETPDSASILSNSNAPTHQGLLRDESSIGVIQKLEHKLAMEVRQKDELEAKCISLKEELTAVTKKKEKVDNLGLKISEMSLRLRNEREMKSKLSKDLVEETRKVEALSDHIEKLMMHLKHEAISKSRSLAEQSRLQREMEMLKTRVEHMAKKNERKDKAICELRETGKLLEDQLRSMDEKYTELRSKLDWTRSQTSKIVKQKELEVTQLREKLSLVVDTTPRHKSNAVRYVVIKMTMNPNSSFLTLIPIFHSGFAFRLQEDYSET